MDEYEDNSEYDQHTGYERKRKNDEGRSLFDWLRHIVVPVILALLGLGAVTIYIAPQFIFGWNSNQVVGGVPPIQAISTPTISVTPTAPFQSVGCDLDNPLTAFDTSRVIPEWHNSQANQLQLLIPDGYDTLYVSSDPAVFNGTRSLKRVIIVAESDVTVEDLSYNTDEGHFNIWGMAFSGCPVDQILAHYGQDDTETIWHIDVGGEIRQLAP